MPRSMTGQDFMRDVTFIIPFRSKQTCADWDATSNACTGTLASIANQRSGNARCILVCHERPEIVPDNMDIEIVQAPFDPPPHKGYRLDKSLYRGDKRGKIALGLERYLEKPTDLYMVCDADDRVHWSLTEYLGSSQAETFLIRNGYVYGGGGWIRAHKGDFDKLCGSVAISNRIDAENGVVPKYWQHHLIGERCAELGKPLDIVPFFAALKNVGYGGNMTRTQVLFSSKIRRTVKKALMMRPVNRRMEREFALDTHPI